MNKKTALKEGERIRLYYKVEDLILYDGDERLTCHYPLHQRIKIRVHDAKNGKIELLGKRIRLNKPIHLNTKYVLISEDAFVFSNDKDKCAIRVTECLDEEFINGKKLMHVAIKGVEGYLSFITSKDITCFGKDKVWLNIVPKKIIFTV